MYIWAQEIAGNVIFFFEGSIDLSGFMAPTNDLADAGILPSGGIYLNGDEPSSTADVYSAVVPGTQAFGSGVGSISTHDTGDTFGFTSSAIALPLGYISRTPIRGTMTFAGDTFTTLGVDPTPFSFETALGANTIHMFTRPPVAPSAVDNSVLRTALQKKIKKLSKKAKVAKRRGQGGKAKKLKKKIKKLKRRLRGLG